MSSIIIQHKSEVEALVHSKIGHRLEAELIKSLRDTMTVNPTTSQKIAALLQIDSLSPEISSPWCRANMLATWCNTVDWIAEKHRAKEQLKLVEKLNRLYSLILKT